MKHATQSTLAGYASFLDSIRAIDGMVERSPGVFYRKSKAFLHFHEDATGLYADLRSHSDEEFVRWRVESRAEQSAFLKTIADSLRAPVRK